MHQQFIQFKGANISYNTAGTGSTVMLLHGFGEDGTVFCELVAALQQQYKFIVPDLPGSGQSHLIPNANIDTYAEVAKAIWEAETINKDTAQFSLIGHSMGGYIALSFAEKYPALLNCLGLFHSSAFSDSAEKKAIRSKAIEFIKEKGAYPFLKTSIPGLFHDENADATRIAIVQLLEKSKSFTPEALIQYYDAMINRPERIAVLKSFPAPVLFIIGEHDKAIPLQSSLEQCHLPAISHVHILTESGHMGMFEQPVSVLAALTQFLEHVNTPAQ